MTPSEKPQLSSKKWNDLSPDSEDIWQAKLDGAFLYLNLDKENGAKAFSYRRSKRTGEPIEHTHKILGIDNLNIPDELDGVTLEGEAWHPDLKASEIGGILNTKNSPVNTKLLFAVHGIHGSGDAKNNFDNIEQIKSIVQQMPSLTMPDTATSPEEKEKLLKDIEDGKHPQTKEGIVGYPEHGKAYKSVIEPTFDLPVDGVTSGMGKYEDRGAGAILVRGGRAQTAVGTGLSDKLREVLLKNKDKLKGLVATVKAKEQFSSDKLRAPVFVEFHPTKSEPSAYSKIMTEMQKQSSDNSVRLFVYGTFRSGFENNKKMSGATLEKYNVSTANRYALFDRNGSPAMSEMPGCKVVGELYNVPMHLFAKLSKYESDNGGKHEPKEIELSDGSKAIAFLVPRKESAKWDILQSGDWSKRMIEKVAKKEYAPGIPSHKSIQNIPEFDGEWDITVHEHNANKAGKHYDLRLGDPETGHSHSWALPKATFPDSKNRVRLAVQQPTHTTDYMSFEGDIPSGYGAGSVSIKVKGTTRVSASNDKVNFSIPGSGAMSLIRKDGNNWMLIKKSESNGAMKFRDILLESFLEKISAFETNTDPSLKTRISPFRKDVVSKAKTPFTVKAPDITPLSQGKADIGKLE